MDANIITGLFTLVGITVTGITGLIAGKMTAGTQRKTEEIKARGPEWKSFIEEIRTENQNTKNELRQEIATLRSEVQELKSWKRQMSGKYQASLAYILKWRRKYPRDPLVDVLPAEIREDLPSYWPRDEPNV